MREWKCVLAGGAHHLEVCTQLVGRAQTFPPAVILSDGTYEPMTLTGPYTGAPPHAMGKCVLAHHLATLEQVTEAHELLLRHGLRLAGCAPLAGLAAAHAVAERTTEGV